MNRREFVQATAAQSGLDPKVVDHALRNMTDVITAVNARGEPVAISGFAKFARVDRAARMARNPATGEPVKVKASKKAKITALKAYKDGVMSLSAAPKLSKGVWPPAPAAKKAPARKVTPPAAKGPARARPAKAPATTSTAAKKGPTKKASAAKKAPAKRTAKR